MLNKRDKRGQGLQISTIILIVLGVLVLIFLVYGFVVGWNNLLPWINPGNNVDRIRTQCQVACSTNSVYGFCEQQITVKVDGVDQTPDTCQHFVNNNLYGIESCPALASYSQCT